jgi:hypothetical protein
MGHDTPIDRLENIYVELGTVLVGLRDRIRALEQENRFLTRRVEHLARERDDGKWWDGDDPPGRPAA